MTDEKKEETLIDKNTVDTTIDDCSKEIKEILDKYNCEVDAQFIINSQGMTPMVRVVKKK